MLLAKAFTPATKARYEVYCYELQLMSFIFTGTINTMSTLEVAATFNVDSKIRKQLESLKAFTFWLEDVKIEIEFGGKMSVQ